MNAVLGNDITLTPPSDGTSNFTAIGFDDYPFIGIFDGKGYKISGIVIKEDGLSNQGLFGYAGEGSVIKNFGVTGGSITGNQNVSGICGDGAGLVAFNNFYYSGAIVAGASNFNIGTELTIEEMTGSLVNYMGFSEDIWGVKTNIVPVIPSSHLPFPKSAQNIEYRDLC